MAHGYAGACMDDVAKGAGVSKKTLYRLDPRQGGSVQDIGHRPDRAIPAGGRRRDDGLARCRDRAGAADDRIRQSDVVSGDDRDSETRHRRERPVPGTRGELSTRTRSWRRRPFWSAFSRGNARRGSLALDDPHAAAGMLRGMMIMEPQRAVMIGHAAVPSAAEIAARARVCVDGVSARDACARGIRIVAMTPVEN